MKFLRLIIPFFYCSISFLHAQDWTNDMLVSDSVYSEKIGSPRLFLTGEPLSDPVIELGTPTFMELHFDYLSKDIADLAYTIVHCTSDWKKSDLNEFDYMEGFSASSFYNYDFSMSEVVPYIHYELTFPNADLSPKLSGNYLLVVFDESSPSEILFTRRFYVVERILQIDAYSKQPSMGQYAQTHQELIFEINYQDFNLRNPFQELQVTLMQNWRLDNAYFDVQPIFIKQEKLIYRREGKYVFKAHKEFRFFDIRDLRMLGSEVRDYNYMQQQIRLIPDEVTVFKPYFLHNDINLKYLVDVKDQMQPELRADYNDVKFTLQTNTPYSQGEVYVFGALSNWRLKEDFKMTYNFETRAYEADIKLKQGYYNYAYSYLKEGEDHGDASYFLGNHFEAENDYYIFAYYKGMGDRYQRIIGYKKINSLKRE